MTADPELLSLFPMGGRPGTTVDVQIRGTRLEGSYAVWFESEGLRAAIKTLEEVPADEKVKENIRPYTAEEERLVYRVSVEIEIGHSARIGTYPIRLVSPQGLTNAVLFRVVEAPVVLEASTPHHAARQAQAVSLPTIVYGRLAKPGEQDYYALDADEGQEISFKAIFSEGCRTGYPPRPSPLRPRLALYGSRTSWLDSRRPHRILFNEERSSDLIPVSSRVTYRVAEPGRYALEVSSLFGKGTPDCPYQLRISSLEGSSAIEEPTHSPRGEWRERAFSRKLDKGWIAGLRLRAVDQEDDWSTSGRGSTSAQVQSLRSDPASEPVEVGAATGTLSSRREREPNDSVGNALGISLPLILEGTIERPGDIDSFEFNLEAGQKLAFEIETPQVAPPHFNPRVGISDAAGREQFTNVHSKISLYNNFAERQVYLKAVEPKVVVTFDSGGKYFLQVRDLTSRYGDPSYAYRVLIRPQIPHVGEIWLDKIDRFNLVPGEAKKLTILTSHEEGFTGDVAFSVTGLPSGVEALAAAEVNDARAPMEVTVNPEMILPKTQETTIVLLTAAAASPTPMPAVIQLHCRPILEGEPGSTLLVREIPLMVVKATDSPKEETRKPRGSQ